MSDETLFHLALEKPTGERPAFLEQALPGTMPAVVAWKNFYAPTKHRTASWSARR